jgi:hypothetical protein
MAYDNNYQRGGASVGGVNTSSIALFASDSTMLRIGFNNDAMFLTIIPRVADPQGGRPRWPKELGHTATFRAAQALSLYKGFVSKVLPDIEAEKDHPGYCVVPLNRDGTTLAGFTFAGGNAIFSIFYNVGVDHTTTEQFNYIFEPTLVMDTYNPTTGQYVVAPVQGQLFVIVEGLKIFGEHGINAVGHGAKYAMGFNQDMMMSHLQAIATRVGATPAQYGMYRGSFGGSFGGGSYGGGSYGGGYNAGGSMQTPLQQPGPVGSNDTMTWNTGYAAQAEVGQTNVPQVEPLTSLESLMSN